MITGIKHFYQRKGGVEEFIRHYGTLRSGKRLYSRLILHLPPVYTFELKRSDRTDNEDAHNFNSHFCS